MSATAPGKKASGPFRVTLILTEGDRKMVVNAAVNADGSYQYGGAGEKLDKVLAYTADPDGAQGCSSSCSNYYV